MNGWAWNEAHLLRAFLLFNAAFEIDFHGSYLAVRDSATCRRLLPNCAHRAGRQHLVAAPVTGRATTSRPG